MNKVTLKQKRNEQDRRISKKKYCQGSSFDDACMMKPAYIAGANAVLREIEKAFDISKPYLGNPFATLEERARGVYDLVKELKGE